MTRSIRPERVRTWELQTKEVILVAEAGGNPELGEVW